MSTIEMSLFSKHMGVSGYKEERNQIEIANSKAPPAPINAHNVRSTVWAAGRVVSGTRSGGPRHLQGSVRLAWWYSLHSHGEHTQGPQGPGSGASVPGPSPHTRVRHSFGDRHPVLGSDSPSTISG